MLIAQISDCHVTAPGTPSIRGLSTATENLHRTVAHINGLATRPDVVLATGDLVHHPTAACYAVLREALAALTMPVYLIPGNHDDRRELKNAFPEHDYLPGDGSFQHYAIEDYPIRLIGLDTVIPQEVGGAICDERRAWLAERLDEARDRPTLIFMHHPPIPIGVKGMDRINCEGADALRDLIARHPQVERVVCGHVHRPAQMRWGGTVVSTAPSTAAQLRLDLDPGAEPEFVAEPLAYALHYWEAGTGLVSHLSFVGEFAVFEAPEEAD
ncbi:MAG: phosphodiesterase [Alphaproteobacteria bacterium]|nr:phosphodiesterase [Alphaproteobacteria bacterium]